MRIASSIGRARGFTLLELVVVVVIMGVCATLAASDLSIFMGRYRMNSAAREFAKQVQLSRVRAISENREYALVLVESDPTPLDGRDKEHYGRYEVRSGDSLHSSTVWSTVEDGVYDLKHGPNAWKGVSIEPWLPLQGPPTYQLPEGIVFSPRGFLINAPSDFKDGVIRVVFRDKRAGDRDARVVRVDRGGGAMIAAVD